MFSFRYLTGNPFLSRIDFTLTYNKRMHMPQFLIIAHDYKDSEAIDRRLAARPLHLQRMRDEKEKGIFLFAGAKLSEAGNMIGSVIVAELPSMEAAHTWVAGDPYKTQNVWESVEITPFRIAAV